MSKDLRNLHILAIAADYDMKDSFTEKITSLIKKYESMLEDVELREKFAANVKARIVRLEVTQKGLAEKLNVNQNYASLLINGKRVSFPQLIKLSEILGVPDPHLFFLD